MWLLNVRSYRLEWVHDRTAAMKGYAILSHTWDAEEVSFQDMQIIETARQLKGFGKIELTCRQAIADGLRWAWVDTCCIDKKSSAELSEAINSMYRYYARSNCCYVFLSDVEVDPETAKSLPGLGKGPAGLEDSRWFERGWTLQELIAPSCVKFFSKDWHYIGTKSTLAASLAAVTSIDERMLRQKSKLADYTIAQRMSWAAGRETTRIEDQAYSLLGIFGVNMPLLYGEGARAFERLQREIMKDTDDHSIFLWRGRADDDDYDGSQDLPYADILAGSPDNFDHARKIVFLEYYRSRPFEFTNSGLRITVPFVLYDNAWYAVFNCRYINNFAGPLGVKVQYSRSWMASGEEDEYPRYEFNRCIEVIPTEVLVGVEPKTCLFVRSQDGVRRARRVAAAPVVCTFWLLRPKSFLEHFELQALEPWGNWSSSSVLQSTLQWTRDVKGAERGCWGCIAWKYRRGSQPSFTNLLLQVAVRDAEPRYRITVMRTDERLSRADFEEWASITPSPTEELEVHDVDQLLYPSGHEGVARFYSTVEQKVMPVLNDDPGRLEFSAEIQEIFGNLVCVVELSYQAEPAETPPNEQDVSIVVPRTASGSQMSRNAGKRKRNGEEQAAKA